jgi:hypothetical protein
MSFVVVLNDKETFTDLEGCWIYEVTNEEEFDTLGDKEIEQGLELGILRPVCPVQIQE